MRRMWWSVVLVGCAGGQPASEPEELALVGTAPSTDAGTLREVWSCRTQEVGAGAEVTIDASQLTVGPDGSPIEPITDSAQYIPEGNVLVGLVVWNIDQETAASLCDETGFHADRGDWELVGGGEGGVIPVHRWEIEDMPLLLADGAVVEVGLHDGDWPDHWTAAALLLVRAESAVHTATFTDDDLWASL